MKYLVGMMVFLLVMSVARAEVPTATPAPLRFHFDDCVKVTGGFYRGCHGRVKDLNLFADTYEVELTCPNEGVRHDIDSANLKAQDDKVCEGK